MKAIFFLTSEALREAITDYLRKKEGRDFIINEIDPPLRDDDLIKVEVTRREAPELPAEEVSTTEASLFEKCSHCGEHPADMEAHMAAWHPDVQS